MLVKCFGAITVSADEPNEKVTLVIISRMCGDNDDGVMGSGNTVVGRPIIDGGRGRARLGEEDGPEEDPSRCRRHGSPVPPPLHHIE